MGYDDPYARARANDLKDPNRLQIGQVLTLPEKTAVAANRVVAPKSKPGAAPMDRILDTFGRYTGRPMAIDENVYRSESETGHRNRAISHLLYGHEILDREPEEVLDLYFRQCSILVTARDLAMMGACLANNGVNPVTGMVALNSRYVEKVLEQGSALVSVDTVPTERPSDISAVADGLGLDGDPVAGPEVAGPNPDDREGLWALEGADLFNMLCIPPFERDTDVDDATWAIALGYCKTRRAMLIVDSPSAWATPAAVTHATSGVDGLGLRDENAVLYFPRLKMADPLQENRLEEFAACGAVAGIAARTDASRGVWKAAAGQEATLLGVRGLSYKMTDGENGVLNPLGVNCLRTFPVVGHVVWGARTLEGADRLASEWKYLPVRRLALFLEESLYRGTQWVVFEPNDEPLWAQIRLNVGAFMHGLFRQGAFQGTSPRDAYFVKCDSETTTQNDINLGIVNILVGFAPLKPAEFVIIKISQIAGEIQT